MLDAKEWAKNPNRNYFEKYSKIKHPDKPKKPMTPYLRFFTEKRAKFQEENPNLSQTELSKLVATKFTELKVKKKNKYRRRYDNEMAEYREKAEIFRKNHPELFATKSRKKVVVVGPDRPKKPFDLYLASRLKKYAEEDKKAAQEQIRHSWNDLNENKRMKWIKKALKDVRRYNTDVDEYKTEHPDFVTPKLKSVLTKQETDLKNKFDGRPENPPTSGYNLYSKIMLNELKDIPSKEKMVIIAKRWKELSAEEKAYYTQKAKKIQSKYVEKFDAYLQQLSEEDREQILGEKRLKMPSEKKWQKEKKNVREKVILNAALSAFQMQEMIRLQTERPSMNKGALIVTVNKNWEKMNADEKQKYVQIARSLKDFLPGSPVGRAEHSEPKRNAKKDSEEKNFSKLTGISRPPKNGFAYFCSENISSYSDVPPNERMKMIAKVWKNEKTQDDRAKYGERAKKANEVFTMKFRHYKEVKFVTLVD